MLIDAGWLWLMLIDADADLAKYADADADVGVYHRPLDGHFRHHHPRTMWSPQESGDINCIYEYEIYIPQTIK